ncbi:MAG TPA: DUF5990 family protein [Candidatus Acidoferrum sp.]|nr:DUF5990 family protein [Candidatus Acidoferrum sp.]
MMLANTYVRGKFVNVNEVRFRLLRSDDIPATNPHKLAYKFGLQSTKQQIMEGARQPDGMLAFDFTLTVRKGNDAKCPIFTGRYASSPVDDRFVYLSWRAVKRGDYINRVKARLSTIDWEMVRESQRQDRPITADMTGRGPGDPRKYVTWYLG